MDISLLPPPDQSLFAEKWEDLLLRFGLIAGALICWQSATYLWERGDMVRQSLSVWLAIIDYAVSFCLIFCALKKGLPSRANWLILVVASLVILSYLQVHLINQEQFGSPLTTDLRLYGDYAAALLDKGQNPYSYNLLSIRKLIPV